MNYVLHKFLDFITSGYDGIWEVRVIDKSMSKVINRKFFDNKKEVFEWFDRNFDYLKDKNVYFSLLPRIKKSGTKEDVKNGNVFVIDMDFKTDKLRLEANAKLVYRVLNDIMLRPSVIADSGHGLHVYYKLSNPVEIERWRKLNRLLFKLFKKFFKDVTVEMKDEATCIRVIGIKNNKEEPIETRFLYEDYVEYEYDELAGTLNGLVYDVDFKSIDEAEVISDEQLGDIYDFYEENATNVYSIFRVYDSLMKNQNKFTKEFISKVIKMLRKKFDEIGTERILDEMKRRYGKKFIGLMQKLKHSDDFFLSVYTFYKRNKPVRGKSRRWIEELLNAKGIDDGRKRLIWLVFAPYLINIKKYDFEKAYLIIENWLNNNKVAGKRITSSFIRGQLRNAINTGLLPLSKEKAFERFSDVPKILEVLREE